MAQLRGPSGCAWDRKQTHQSLRGYLLEETYEALDAIDGGDIDALRGELGDVLLQIVFHAQVAREAGRFDMAAVADAITAKLIRRHPHVFTSGGRPLSPAARGRLGLDSPTAVKEQWARLKADEQSRTGSTPRVLAGLPRAMPALLRAHAIGARVAAVGFDWPDAADVVDKIEEEVRELREALTEGRARTIDEFGDLLFALANLARKLQVDPEAALSHANDKFSRRFDAVEHALEQQGRDVHATPLAELEAAWNAVKAHEPSSRRRRATTARPRSARGVRGRRSRE